MSAPVSTPMSAPVSTPMSAPVSDNRRFLRVAITACIAAVSFTCAIYDRSILPNEVIMWATLIAFILTSIIAIFMACTTTDEAYNCGSKCAVSVFTLLIVINTGCQISVAAMFIIGQPINYIRLVGVVLWCIFLIALIVQIMNSEPVSAHDGGADV